MKKNWDNAILVNAIESLQSKVDNTSPTLDDDPSRLSISQTQFGNKPMITHPLHRVVSIKPEDREYSVNMEQPERPKYDVPLWFQGFGKS